jgi:hypothetical protein
MVLGNMDHRELDAASPSILIGRRDMGGAAELKLILAFADVQLGSAGRVGTSAKRAEPNFNAFERRGRGLLVTLTVSLYSGLAVAGR